MPKADGERVAQVGNGQHILVIAAHFAPESTSGTHRSIHFARALYDAGFRVSVVTVDSASLGSVDSKLNSVFPYEDHILRVPLRATLETTYLACKKPWVFLRDRLRGSHDDLRLAASRENARRRSAVRRELSGVLSFPDRYRGWYRPALEAAEAVALKAPVHAVFASGPPWTALMVARAASLHLDCKLITDFRDPWTARMGFADPDKPRFYSSWSEREEDRIIARSSAVLFNSPDLMANSRRNLGNLPAAVHCILNGTDMPARVQERRFPTTGALLIRHLGSLYGGRSVDSVIDAIAASAVDRSRIAVELIGPADGETTGSIHGSRKTGVVVDQVGSLPHSEAARLMDQPAVLLAVQSRKFSAQIPTKLYEYLRTGNPILVLAEEDSAAWRFASQFERCSRLDFDDIAGNTAIVQRLFDQWSAGNLAQVSAASDTASFGKAIVGREFAYLMSDLLADGPRPRQAPRTTHRRIWSDPETVSH